MYPDLQGWLKELDRRLIHLKELLEWQRLFDSEKPLALGRFGGSDSNQQDIAVVYGSFVGLAGALQTALDELPGDVPLDARRHMHAQLRELVQECHDLAVPERYINR